MFPAMTPAPAWPILRNALAGRLRLSRVPPEKVMGAAQKSTRFECAELPPADLGDGRRSVARQQAAAHRLVLGRLPDGDPLQRLLPCSSRNSSVSALTAALGCSPTSCAPAAGRPRAQPVVGPGGNRRGQPSIPDQRRSSHRSRKDAASTAMLIVGAIELGDGNIPGRLRLAEISSYGAADLGHFVETAADPDAAGASAPRGRGLPATPSVVPAGRHSRSMR